MKNINKLILVFCTTIAIFAVINVIYNTMTGKHISSTDLLGIVYKNVSFQPQVDQKSIDQLSPSSDEHQDVVIQNGSTQMCGLCYSNSDCDTGFCSMPDNISGMCYITGCECGAATCNLCAECNTTLNCEACTQDSQCQSGNCVMPDGISGTCYITGCPCGMATCGTCNICGGTPYCEACTTDAQCQPGINDAEGQCVMPDGITGTCYITNCVCGMETCGTCYQCDQPNCYACTQDSQCQSTSFCDILPGDLSGTCQVNNCECGPATCDTCKSCCVISGQGCVGSTNGIQGTCCDGLMCAVCASQAASNGEAGICQDPTIPTLLACNSATLGTICQTLQECQTQYDCIDGLCQCGAPAGLNCPCQSSNTCVSPLVCGEVDTCVYCSKLYGPCNNNDQCCTNNPYCVAMACSCATSNCGSSTTVGNGCECNENTQCCSGSCMNAGAGTDGSCENPGLGGAVCYNAGNCSAGFYCDLDSEGTSGTCTCNPVTSSSDDTSAGLACGCYTQSQCVSGLYCNGIEPNEGSCEEGNSLGLPCVSANECSPNNACQHVTGFEINQDPHNETFTLVTLDTLPVDYYDCGHGSCTLTASVPAKITNSSQYIDAVAEKDEKQDVAQAYKSTAQKDELTLQTNKYTAKSTAQENKDAAKTIGQTDKNTAQAKVETAKTMAPIYKSEAKSRILNSSQYAEYTADQKQKATDQQTLATDKATYQTTS